jgi:hypothetical protein
VGGACGTYGRERKVYEVMWERDHLEDRGVDGRMGSEWILRRLAGGGGECIHLAWDKDHWHSLVDTVMNQSRSVAIFRYSLRSCAEKYFKTVRINFFGFLHNFFVMI